MSQDVTHLATKRVTKKQFTRKVGFTMKDNGTTGVIRTIHEEMLAQKCMSIPRKSSNVVLELIHK